MEDNLNFFGKTRMTTSKKIEEYLKKRKTTSKKMEDDLEKKMEPKST